MKEIYEDYLEMAYDEADSLPKELGLKILKWIFAPGKDEKLNDNIKALGIEEDVKKLQEKISASPQTEKFYKRMMKQYKVK